LWAAARAALPGLGRAVCLWAALWALRAAPPALAVELKIQAPSFQFDTEKHIYRYQEARLEFEGQSLEAQDVRVNADTGQILGVGQVRFRDRGLFVSASRIELDAEKGTGVLTGARLYDSATGYYLTAARIVRTERGTYEAESCSLTACPPLVPSWHLTAAHVNYEVDSFATGSSATLSLGPMPILWMPVLAWPTVQQRRSGVLRPEYSRENSSLARYDLGTRLAVPYFLDLGLDQDLTLSPEFIENRGNALGLDYRYAFREDQAGGLKLWQIQENYRRDALLENAFVDPAQDPGRQDFLRRYTLDWSHNQTLGESARLVAGFNGGSDGQVRREYQHADLYRPERAYQVSVSNQAPWGDLALTTEHTSEFVQESVYADRPAYADGSSRPALLPRLTYHAGQRLFEAFPLAVQISTSAGRFESDYGVSGTVATVRPALTLPLRLTEGVELRATVLRKFVQYDSLRLRQPFLDERELPAQGFSQDEATVELNAALLRDFPQPGPPLRTLRHRITPRLLLQQVQDVPQPLVDRMIRARVAQRMVTLRLDNAWQGQTAAPEETPAAPWEPAPRPAPTAAIASRVAPLGQLNLIQRYSLLREDPAYQPEGPALPTDQETLPGQPLLPAILQGSVGLRGITLGTELHYHHQLGRLHESIISATGTARPNSTLGVNYSQNEFSYWTPENKLHPVGTGFGFFSETPLSDEFSFGLNGQLNLNNAAAPLDRRLQSGQAFVDFHPICYRLRASYAEALDVTQEAGLYRYFINRRFIISVDLGGLFQGSRTDVIGTGVLVPGSGAGR
jgi:hypothetical protein